MARKRRKAHLVAGELNLVAMIDVAFQLLNFFLITVKPMDVMTHLSVFRPMAEKASQEQSVAEVIRITVFPEGFTLNDSIVNKTQLESKLRTLAAMDAKQSVLIQCTNESPHSKLVELLDLCAKLKLTQLSVISSNAY